MKQAFAQQLIQSNTRAHQQARAAPLRKSQHPKEEQGNQGDDEQGGCALGHHHTVVHLQHVDGGCQHQQVGHHAEHARRHEFASETPKRSCQLIAIEKIWHFHFDASLYAAEGEGAGDASGAASAGGACTWGCRAFCNAANTSSLGPNAC